MLIVLTILFFLIALILMGIILIQPGSSGGLGFIGGGSQSAFGTQTGNVVTKLTTVFAALFIVVSLFLGYLNARQSRVDEDEIQKIQERVQEVGEEEEEAESVGVEFGVDISDTNE